ncbi:MAG TPA: anti-sigma factor [Gaiella sp.]|uniref:anti-sigma factor n=1 Tax=Gaiella sp. TaxID=2663207 RepID=UPI002D7ED2EE|nr:anti-sigma factor [Gaiella sp.]HET9286626.1 anti-sigma factor [Gaiella sp.]
MSKSAHAHPVPPGVSDEVVEASLGVPVPLPALELAAPRRPAWPTLAALAITCGVLAVALGAFALVAELRSGPAPATTLAAGPALAILADSEAERVPLRGSVGRIVLVVGDGDRGVLTLDGLGPAAEGRMYAAWVVPPGSAVPVPAGSFDGSEQVIPLTRQVRTGARVAVTLEPSGRPNRPSRPLRLVAVRG